MKLRNKKEFVFIAPTTTAERKTKSSKTKIRKNLSKQVSDTDDKFKSDIAKNRTRQRIANSLDELFKRN